jgi:ATP-binding cassette subfamily F protein 3
LSGGEKSRLTLLKMFLKPMNLLILDEPTNHLDLYSKDILLDALKKFTGTIIFVSHDRAFMEELSTKTLELTPGTDSAPAKAKLFYGNYAYYLDSKANAVNYKPESRQMSKVKDLIPDDKKQPDYTNMQKRTLDKQKQTAIRRLERQEVEIIKSLEELETEKAKLEAELARADVYSNGEKTKAVKLKLDEFAAVIEAKTHEWETITKELDNITFIL